jgi:RNase P subunit RPR2
MSLSTARQRRRRALAHQCLTCRRHWALRLVEHPAGNVVLCRHCGAVHRVDLGSSAGDRLGRDRDREVG